jgi:PAS domain S-box-containing protein
MTTSSLPRPASGGLPGTATAAKASQERVETAQLPSLTDAARQIRQLQAELDECRASLREWMEAEATWSDQRRLFKIMTANVTDLIVLLDPNGNRLWNNPAYSHTLGYSTEEIAGTFALSEVHPDDQPRAMEAFEQSVAQKTSQQAEYRMQQKGGAWLHLQTEIVPTINAEGQIVSLVLMAHNVTEKRKLEEALALATSTSTTAGMVERMARDFDQILTNASGSLAIARNLNGPHNAVAVRMTEIERALQRARDLIEQMFSLTPKADQPKERVALEPVVHEAVSTVLRGTMVRAEYLFARNLPELELDLEGFGHAIRNLVTNSVQATDKGVIRLTAEYIPQEQFILRHDIPLKAGNYVCLRIQDQGHGMTEKTLLHAFEPYFTTRPNAQGLGLTTALAAIQRMGGTILLDSTPQVGTTTYIYLPTLNAPAKAMRSGTTALTKPLEKKRVLLMDDEQMILDIVSRMLTHLGYEVSICTDGAQAIALFAKAKSNGQPFDVVLMDLVIPNGVGGQDAVHTIKKIDPHAKVIASSGHLEHPAMIDHQKFSFVAVLEKPYKLERLQQVIDAVIESPA